MFTENYKVVLAEYEKFWERKNTKRPILGISYQKPGTTPYRAPKTLEEKWLDSEYKYNSFKHNTAITEYIAEGIPMHWTNYGPGCLAGCIGSSFVLQPDTVWFDSKQLITDWENPPEISFDEKSELWQYLIKEQALFASDPNAHFSITDIGGIMDVVASLRGTQNLLYDLYDYPDEVKEFAQKVKAEWNKLFDKQLEIVRNAGQPYNTWMNVPSAKPWYAIQCDFCYMISPNQFSEFVLPDIVDQVNYMERSIYHLDGVGELPHLDMLLDIPNLTGIQWVPGAGIEPERDEKWFGIYRKIQDKKKNLVLSNGISEHDMAGVERLIKSIDPAGVYLHIDCSCKEKAEEMLEKITRWSE